MNRSVRVAADKVFRRLGNKNALPFSLLRGPNPKALRSHLVIVRNCLPPPGLTRVGDRVEVDYEGVLESMRTRLERPKAVSVLLVEINSGYVKERGRLG